MRNPDRGRALPPVYALVAALTLHVLTPSFASAQQLWGEVGLPGGAAGARRMAGLGDPQRRTDATWLLDFVRKSGTSDLERTAKPLERYFQVMERLQSELGRWPDGVVLPATTAPDQEREQVEKVCDLLGLELVRQRGSYRVEPRNSEESTELAVWLKWSGIDRPRTIAALNFGLKVRLSVSESTLPLPLPGFWSAEVFKRDVAPLVSILSTRWTLWTYLGLMALDEGTLTYLRGQPRLVRRMGEDTGGVFAAFGHSLRIAGGVVEVPGGPPWLPVWEQLVDRRANQPAEFVLNLLNADEGRLAYFYATVAQLNANQQSFVLGSHLPANRRAPFVRNLYRWFRNVDPSWSVASAPLRRPDFDPFLIFAFVDIRLDGTVGPVWWTGVLERVFATHDWPSRQQQAERAHEMRAPDALWLLQWLFETPGQARIKFETLRYAQRHFASTPIELGGAVELALRARAEMPALALSLERMGIDSLELSSALATTAHRLTASGGYDDAGPRLRRWQGALGLLEQIQLRVGLPRATLEELLHSLSTAIPANTDHAAGVVGAWVCERLLPTVLSSMVVDGDFERAALVGFATSKSRPMSFSWEGLSYTNDPSGLVARSALAVRQFRLGPRLQHLVALSSATRALEAPLASVADLQTVIGVLTPLEAVLATLPTRNAKTSPMAKNFHDSLGRLRRVSRPADLKRVARERETLLAAVDSLTDAVVPALLYSLASSPTSVPAVMGDAWFSHDLRDPERGGGRHRPWQLTAWLIPTGEVRQRGGTSMVGSLLAVDVALSDARLVRLPTSDVPDGSVIDPDAAPAIAQVLALGNWHASDGLADAVTKITGGRRRVGAWRAQLPDRLETESDLRAASVDGWRTNVVLWRAARDPLRAFDELSPTELYRLGGGGPFPEELAAPMSFIDGCLCRAHSEMPPPEAFRGRRIGGGAAMIADLNLRLAEHLTTLKLPLALLPTVLPAAVQDWLDQVSQVWLDDWESLAVWPRRMSVDRVEEYLLQLIASGAFVPAESGQ